MTEIEVIRRCPFCEGEWEVYHHIPAHFAQSWHVECNDCGCGTCHHETRAEAIAAWNRRAGDSHD